MNEALQHEMIQRPPRFPKNKICKILYATQIAVDAPTFIVFVNHKARANFAFKKWVENSIRKNFWFIGVPIVIKYRNRWESWKERDIFVKYNEEDVENAGLEVIQPWDDYEEETPVKKSRKSDQTERNPYTNKWIRKREKHVSKHEEVKKSKKRQRFPTDNKIEEKDGNSKKPEVKKSSTHEAKKKKKLNQYSNVKTANQWKLNAMFAEAYWDKKQKKSKRSPSKR